MKFYLSSYKLGNETEKFVQMIPDKKIVFISNALDFTGADPERRNNQIEKDVNSLKELGLEVEVVDLRDYFHKADQLENKLNNLKAIYICGGNVFVLRQAMKLSGLDELLIKLKNRDDFLYAGYSAAGCVLSPSLKAYEIVDQVDTPYEELKEVIWNGLGLIDYAFMPHWESDHPEAADVKKEVELCKRSGIPYRTVRDGEVVIIE